MGFQGCEPIGTDLPAYKLFSDNVLHLTIIQYNLLVRARRYEHAADRV